jgi:eukaryotic sulfide quinone oxidoreductase
VKGLVEALASDARVCSNYSPLYVDKTYKALQDFKGGPALFTFPNTPIKCAGAPQKIMYIADQYLRKVFNKIKLSMVTAPVVIKHFDSSRAKL